MSKSEQCSDSLHTDILKDTNKHQCARASRTLGGNECQIVAHCLSQILSSLVRGDGEGRTNSNTAPAHTTHINDRRENDTTHHTTHTTTRTQQHTQHTPQHTHHKPHATHHTHAIQNTSFTKRQTRQTTDHKHVKARLSKFETNHKISLESRSISHPDTHPHMHTRTHAQIHTRTCSNRVRYGYSMYT